MATKSQKTKFALNSVAYQKNEKKIKKAADYSAAFLMFYTTSGLLKFIYL